MLADKIAYMAQLVEHILGKDEVPGSNPGISLKRRRSVERLDGIFIFGGKNEEKTFSICLFYVLTDRRSVQNRTGFFMP